MFWRVLSTVYVVNHILLIIQVSVQKISASGPQLATFTMLGA